MQRIADVPYGPDPAQRMDVYVPAGTTAGASAQRAPVIFMVHGGGWRIGDKAMGRVVQEKVEPLAPEGFILISPITACCLRSPCRRRRAMCRLPWWRRSSVPAPGAGIPAASSLMGHQAGAHLVALFNAHAPQAQREGRCRGWAPWRSTVP